MLFREPGFGWDTQHGIGEGGRSYGLSNLRILHLGSGGGSGSDYVDASAIEESGSGDSVYVDASAIEESGSGDSVYVNASADAIRGGKGGNGGGAIHLDARNIIRVTGQVCADGDDGETRYKRT